MLWKKFEFFNLGKIHWKSLVKKEKGNFKLGRTYVYIKAELCLKEWFCERLIYGEKDTKGQISIGF